MHNMLAASDYGLLDQKTHELLPQERGPVIRSWLERVRLCSIRKISVPANTYLYAQCLKGETGGVKLLIINADRQHSFELNLPTASERYTLTAEKLEDTPVEVNGKPLRLARSRDLPPLGSEPVTAGRVSFAPTGITYLTVRHAGNADCR